MMGATSMMIPYWVAIGLRLYMMSGSMGVGSFNAFDAAQRVEVVTPLNAHHRLVEGVALYRNGQDPYEGVLCHEPPLLLRAYDWALQKKWLARKLPALYIMLDLLTAALVGVVARLWLQQRLQRQAQEAALYHADAPALQLDAASVAGVDLVAQLAYLFNPFLMLTAAAQTSTVLDNFVLALFLMFLLQRQRVAASLCLAWATYKSLYPVMLLVPLVLAGLEGRSGARAWTLEILGTLTLFGGFGSGLIWLSYELMGRNASFVGAVYGFILSVPELTPNMGLFWYFFTEMFEHFRLFFVGTFQLNTFIYVLPLAIKLRKDPFLLAFTLLGLTAIFKSYPSYGDVGFYLALVPILSHLIPYTKHVFVVGVMLAVTTILGPILLHLWVYNGSANANYFFAINLVFGAAQIFLITDLLFAYLKREFYLFNGYKMLKTGSPLTRIEDSSDDTRQKIDAMVAHQTIPGDIFHLGSGFFHNGPGALVPTRVLNRGTQEGVDQAPQESG
eukprot:snap_masked-scaffold34_size539781-processed-gene-0.0 protein:Tk05346 transcript:snap_masked-scaffold34_size539781-processed-gene-0.0-mRNA-1 annotation:"phosphatidylinositol glycan anchor biosynthesis class u protein"